MTSQQPESTTIAAIEALIRQDRGRLALASLRRSPPRDASPADALALQAQALATLAEFAAAIEAAQGALALDERSARAFQALGTVCAMQRRPAEAIGFYSRAIATDPGYAPPYHALGLLLLEAGDRERAATALRQAQALAPGDWRYAAGVALLEPPRRRAVALRAAYRAALAERPGSIGLRFRLLGTYLTSAAAPVLRDAAGSDPRLGRQVYQLVLSRQVLLTYAILLANVAMFVFCELQGGSQNTAVLDRYGALDGALIIHQGQWWRLVTPMFLHAGLMHLLVNGVSLYYVGTLYERCVGRARFLAVYFLAGIGGSVLSVARANEIGVGASGAIFGLFGALGVFFYQNRAVFGPIARGLVRQVVALSVLNLALPLAIANIDGWAHVGGLITGIIAAAALGPVLRRPQPGDDPAAVLAERRPHRLVLMLAAVVAVGVLAAAVLVLLWNPVGA